jgi:hypothetical protein
VVHNVNRLTFFSGRALSPVLWFLESVGRISMKFEGFFGRSFGCFFRETAAQILDGSPFLSASGG